MHMSKRIKLPRRDSIALGVQAARRAAIEKKDYPELSDILQSAEQLTGIKRTVGWLAYILQLKGSGETLGEKTVSALGKFGIHRAVIVEGVLYTDDKGPVVRENEVI